MPNSGGWRGGAQPKEGKTPKQQQQKKKYAWTQTRQEKAWDNKRRKSLPMCQCRMCPRARILVGGQEPNWGKSRVLAGGLGPSHGRAIVLASGPGRMKHKRSRNCRKRFQQMGYQQWRAQFPWNTNRGSKFLNSALGLLLILKSISGLALAKFVG